MPDREDREDAPDKGFVDGDDEDDDDLDGDPLTSELRVLEALNRR